MAEYTENFNLKKPGQNDFYSIEDFNDNTDIIDAELKKLNDVIEDLNAENITLPDGKTIAEKFDEIKTEIGNIEELDTDIKANVIAAINEIFQALAAHKAESVYETDGVHGLEIEEGTFTPILIFNDIVPTGVTYSRQVGVYRKIGKRVEFTLTIETSTFTHSFTNEDLRISSLPFPIAPNQFIALTGYVNRFTKAGYTQIFPRIWSSGFANRILLYAIGSGQNWDRIKANDLPSGTNITIEISGSYLTN